MWWGWEMINPQTSPLQASEKHVLRCEASQSLKILIAISNVVEDIELNIENSKAVSVGFWCR